MHNIKGKEYIYSISPPPDLPRPRQRRISDKGEGYSFPPRAGGIEREGDKMISALLLFIEP
jgi:hypothetical protein